MCGRFYLDISIDEILAQFDLAEAPDFPSHFNIVPSQAIPVVREVDACREMTMMRWGLVPGWSKKIDSGYSLHNARAETVADKPVYRSAYKKRRCLIPASGFYEWKTEQGGKQPYCIRLANHKPMAFAGLWEGREVEGQAIESCTIIVTAANDIVRPVHDRMPVIIDPADYALWMSPEQQTEQAGSLLRAYPSERMEVYPVSRKVNSPANNDPGCIAPVEVRP